MKIGDTVYIKTSFGYGFGQYRGKLAKIVGKNPYHEKVWNIEILDWSQRGTKINNVKEKELELMWSVS